MGLVIPDGFAEVAWVIAAPDDPRTMEVTIGVEVTGTPTPTDIFNLYVDGGWGDLWHILGADAFTVVKGVATVGAASPPYLSVETTFADSGAAGSGGALINTAILVKKQTATPGRSGRGRMYWPGAPEAEISSAGGVNSTYIGNINAQLAVIGTAGPSPWGNYVVLHASTTPGSPSPHDITSMIAENMAATQRTRLRK